MLGFSKCGFKVPEMFSSQSSTSTLGIEKGVTLEVEVRS
jgi:hypothetical protein